MIEGHFKNMEKLEQDAPQFQSFRMQDENIKEYKMNEAQRDVEKVQIMEGCKRIIIRMPVRCKAKKQKQLSMIINIINIGNNFLQGNFPVAINLVQPTKSIQIPTFNRKEQSYSIQYLYDVLYDSQDVLQKQVLRLSYTASLLNHKISQHLASVQISMKLNQFSKKLLSQVEAIAKANFL